MSMIEGVSQRIAAARAAKGLSTPQLAAALGISVAWADDLETYEDDLTSTLSLGQICRLAELLGMSPRALICGAEQPAGAVGPHDIALAIDEARAASSQTLEEFGTAAGWSVDSVVQDPERMWTDWNLEAAQDVCAMLTIDWRLVLPAARR